MNRDFELVGLVVDVDVDLGRGKRLPVGRARTASECYEILVAIVDVRSAASKIAGARSSHVQLHQRGFRIAEWNSQS
jgi:metal-sulfur cluster biosynthetic enzyme